MANNIKKTENIDIDLPDQSINIPEPSPILFWGGSLVIDLATIAKQQLRQNKWAYMLSVLSPAIAATAAHHWSCTDLDTYYGDSPDAIADSLRTAVVCSIMQHEDSAAAIKKLIGSKSLAQTMTALSDDEIKSLCHWAYNLLPDSVFTEAYKILLNDAGATDEFKFGILNRI